MKGPWHIWVVGILALLWNGGGAYDYVMTQTNNEAYLNILTDAQRAFVDARPIWFDAAWAFGVWGAMVGSLLLLFRSRFAKEAFAVSLIGLAASSVWSYGIADPSGFDVSGLFSLIFSIAIAISLVVLFGYARVMTRKGVLR